MHSEKTYYSIFINAVEGIFQTTPDGHYLNVNPSLAKMYGYDSPSELMRSVTNIASQLYVNPNRRQQFIEEMASHGIVKDFISQIYKKDGTKIWISENVRIVRDHTNKILYYEGFVSDMTSLKEAEERNVKLQKRLQQAEKLESIGRMASGIAHDFNNILIPIIGYAEMLVDMLPDKSKTQLFTKNILKSSHRAKDLVSQIHAFGQPDTLKRKPMQIGAVISEVKGLLPGTMPANIKFMQNIDANVPKIVGDPTQIHQILMNLCTNAIHAMEPAGGELSIRLRERNFTAGTLPSQCLNMTPGQFVELSVTDSGKGIPKEVLPKIFDPYFTTKGKGKGTGLGLATVHSIVKSYLGDVIVKSKVGKGTTFHIFFPAFVAEPQSKSVVKDNTLRKHIMLVDDDKDVLQFQGTLVEHLGYKVSMFDNSQLALDSFNNNPDLYDLVLTDLNMPEMTGLDLSRSLLSISAKLPIIICTGFSEDITETMAQSIGIKKLLLKPVNIDILSKQLDYALQ